VTRHLPIRLRLVGIGVLTGGAVALLICMTVALHARSVLRTSLVRTLSVQASMLGYNALSSLLFSDPDSAEKTLGALAAEPQVVRAGVYAVDGHLFASYLREGQTATPLPPTLDVSPSGSWFGSDGLTVSRPIVFEGQTVGVILIVSDLKQLHGLLRGYLMIMAILLACALALSFFLASRLERPISEPLLELEQLAKRVSLERDYTVRALPRGRDEIGALFAAFNDMLEQIRINEQELRRAQETLEQRVAVRTAELGVANKELEAFSYSVSHDLRAPLRHISGFADMLREKLGDATPEVSRCLDKVCQAAGRMGNLIDDLLSFSRMGRAELRATRVELAAMVADIVREQSADNPGRTIEWRVHPLPVVHADPALLRQVLVNLIANAVKYTAKSPIAHIEISAVQDAREVVVSVRDNGVGFDMAYAHKLFGVFQRLHSSNEFEGTGIGLANVQRIASRHGGRTWAEAKVNQGATFYFSLPLNGGTVDERQVEAHPAG
jgi:signal transduction histidine kinase